MKKTVMVLIALCVSQVSYADIQSSSQSHYVLKHEAYSELPPEEVWKKLITPSSWWHPDHTYSGDSENISFDAQAGGLWREDWQGNSVLHGEVLLVNKNKTLRLNAPFGPLQALGVNTVWTISLTATGSGTTIRFDEVCNGTPHSNLGDIAKAVDFVKEQTIQRLAESEKHSADR